MKTTEKQPRMFTKDNYTHKPLKNKIAKSIKFYVLCQVHTV